MIKAHEQSMRMRWALALIALLVLGVMYGQQFRSANTAQRVNVKIAKSNLRLPYSYEHDNKQAFQHIETNNTFGFERVYLINQARRRDRMTEMQLLLQQYSIPYTVIEAVEGAKERPTSNVEEQRRHGKSQSHAKIWQSILADDISSALVLEDTFDMDVRVKEQMQRLQAPFAALLNVVHGGRNATVLNAHDAWNTGLWDLLWLGQCEEKPWSTDRISQTKGGLPTLQGAPYLSYRDPTRSRVAHHSGIYGAYGVPTNDEESAVDQRLRIIQPSLSPRCTTAYAITKHGAARAVYQSAHKPVIRELDVDLQELIRQGRLRAYTVIPSLFARRFGKDGSSNDGAPLGDADWHNVPVPGYGGQTHGIDMSARKSLLADILGQDKVLVRQKVFVEQDLAAAAKEKGSA